MPISRSLLKREKKTLGEREREKERLPKSRFLFKSRKNQHHFETRDFLARKKRREEHPTKHQKNNHSCFLISFLSSRVDDDYYSHVKKKPRLNDRDKNLLKPLDKDRDAMPMGLEE